MGREPGAVWKGADEQVHLPCTHAPPQPCPTPASCTGLDVSVAEQKKPSLGSEGRELQFLLHH